MNTFVRIRDKNHPDLYEGTWFMVVCPGDNPDFVQDMKFRERMTTAVFTAHMNKDRESESIGILDRALTLTNFNHASIAARIGKPLLVQSIGSFMPMGDVEILESVVSEDFPLKNQNAKICVCENDPKAPKWWIRYLNKRFPGEPVKVINHFSSRSFANLRENLKGVEIVTFSTTFSSFDWVEKLRSCMDGSPAIIGHSWDKEKWREAKNILGDIEIIKYD